LGEKIKKTLSQIVTKFFHEKETEKDQPALIALQPKHGGGTRRKSRERNLKKGRDGGKR